MIKVGENKLQNKLNELWSGIIKYYQINILDNTINFNIEVIENGQSNKYDLVFNKVSSYYFVHNREEQRHSITDPDEGDYLELTSIEYYKNGLDIKMKSLTEDWSKQYYSNANFILEIWNSMLFIEAKSVAINEKVFEVGYSQK